MKNSAHPKRDIGSLFDESERKEIFRKYLFFLGWIELFVFAGCWLYQLSSHGYDANGPIEIPFPWKAYFLISFLAPVAITFLIGVVIIGFNKYFGDQDEPHGIPLSSDGEELPGGKSGRVYKLFMMINWMQKLPFLGLLLLLGVAAGVFYKLDSILIFLGNVGEKSVKILLVAAAVVFVAAVVFAAVLIFLNFKLRKKSMEYQYKSEVAERFGLIILEDNTVINSDGKLLIHGKKLKDVVPLLPATTEPASQSSMPQTMDAKST